MNYKYHIYLKKNCVTYYLLLIRSRCLFYSGGLRVMKIMFWHFLRKIFQTLEENKVDNGIYLVIEKKAQSA